MIVVVVGILFVFKGVIDLLMGFLGIKVFVVVVIGGFGLLSGVLLGGLIIGLVEFLVFCYGLSGVS